MGQVLRGSALDASGFSPQNADIAERSAPAYPGFFPMTDAAIARDQEDFLAKVRRSNAETEKFIEEAFKLRAEEAKLRAEEAKLRAEEGKLGRDRALSPWQLMLTMVAAGTGLFASGATIFKLFGH